MTLKKTRKKKAIVRTVQYFVELDLDQRFFFKNKKSRKRGHGVSPHQSANGINTIGLLQGFGLCSRGLTALPHALQKASVRLDTSVFLIFIWKSSIFQSLQTFEGEIIILLYLEPSQRLPLKGDAIDTQLRDPINSGQTRWRMAVLNK